MVNAECAQLETPKFALHTQPIMSFDLFKYPYEALFALCVVLVIVVEHPVQVEKSRLEEMCKGKDEVLEAKEQEIAAKEHEIAVKERALSELSNKRQQVSSLIEDCALTGKLAGTEENKSLHAHSGSLHVQGVMVGVMYVL